MYLVKVVSLKRHNIMSCHRCRLRKISYVIRRQSQVRSSYSEILQVDRRIYVL